MGSWARRLTQHVQYGSKSREITPSTDNLDPAIRYVVLAEAGDITVVPLGNDDADEVAFVGVQAGFVPPFSIRKVTEATGLVYSIED